MALSSAAGLATAGREDSSTWTAFTGRRGMLEGNDRLGPARRANSQRMLFAPARSSGARRKSNVSTETRHTVLPRMVEQPAGVKVASREAGSHAPTGPLVP